MGEVWSVGDTRLGRDDLWMLRDGTAGTRQN
jgi:murein tripeptide amidase MpaA